MQPNRKPKTADDELTTRGVCPNEPEDPISEETHRVVVAVIGELIARADARPVEEA